MANRRIRLLQYVWITGIVLLATLASSAAATEIVIRIQGDGGNAQYIEEGSTAQASVEVQIGDTVVWRNEGNRTHTATAENEEGDLLFDTDDIPSRSGSDFSSSDPIEMTRVMFDAAGGQSGQPVTIDYFCEHHSSMKSSLVLREAGARNRERPTRRPPRNGRGEDGSRRPGSRDARRGAALLRRDITTLNSGELSDYRDAWRRIQASGAYADVAGYHGCPDEFCHQPGDQITFLAWHREYVLRMEAALGEPLHYWDWTSPTAAASGIPSAFTDATYVSADGNTYPNPLRSYRYTCPADDPAETTIRFPRDPSYLSAYAAQVQSAYESGSYRDLNLSLESPAHNNVHVWVSGSMGGVWHAAYDPIFWAHHANVDRQWASWQQGGGPDPTASDLGEPLNGFSGRTVGNVTDFTALGYEYDRYDSIGDSRGPLVDRGGVRGGGTGVGKTFSVSLPERGVTRGEEQPLDLYVRGIPEHPQRSYFVYVFVNQPGATLDDAKPDNPNFAGTFGVFGMGGPAQAGAEREGHARGANDRRETAEPRPVLQLSSGNVLGTRGAISEVTLVATDETGAVVSPEEVPFTGVNLGTPEEATENRGDARGRGRDREGAPARRGEGGQAEDGEEFEGVSARGSYDEAYRDAVRAAQEGLSRGGRDFIIETEVVSVKGEHGGIAGLNRLTVTIRARLQ